MLVSTAAGAATGTAGDHGAAAGAPADHAREEAAAFRFFTQDGDGPRYPITGLPPGQPLQLRLSGLPPNAPVELTAEWQGCRARGIFRADAIGVVDPSIQASSGGTYQGTDSQGLLWSMVCPAERTRSSRRSRRIHFGARVGGRVVASAGLERLWAAPGVVVKHVNEGGIVGKLYLPPGEGPFPTVIVIGGSEGGIWGSVDRAAYLAHRGFAALALGYFGLPGLPPELKGVPVETFGRAIAWLKRQPRLKTDHLGLWGLSRGGELALLAATKYPQFSAVVAAVPSAVVWPGLSASQKAPVAWTWGGKPVPAILSDSGSQGEGKTVLMPDGKTRAAVYTPDFEAEMARRDRVARAAIPVERIQGPVLLLGGKADALWPSARFTRMTWDRLRSAHHPFADEIHNYADAGHDLCSLPGESTTFEFVKENEQGGWFAFGGTARGNAAAQREALQAIDRFLDANLKPAPRLSQR
jgi:dienelactone hydrolase